MNKSLTTHTTRRRLVIAAAGIAAAGALAVPGIAWAQDGIPASEPTAVDASVEVAPAGGIAFDTVEGVTSPSDTPESTVITPGDGATQGGLGLETVEGVTSPSDTPNVTVMVPNP